MDKNCIGQVCVQTKEKLVHTVVQSYLNGQIQGVVSSSPDQSEILTGVFLGQFDVFLLTPTHNNTFENLGPSQSNSFKAVLYGGIFVKTRIIFDLIHNTNCDCRARNPLRLFCGFYNHHFFLSKPCNSRKPKEM